MGRPQHQKEEEVKDGENAVLVPQRTEISALRRRFDEQISGSQP